MRYLTLLPILCCLNLEARVRFIYPTPAPRPQPKAQKYRYYARPSTAVRPLWSNILKPKPTKPQLRQKALEFAAKQQKPEFNEYAFYKLKQKMGYKDYDDQYNRWKQSTAYLAYMEKKRKKKTEKKKPVVDKDIDEKNAILVNAVELPVSREKKDPEDIGDED